MIDKIKIYGPESDEWANTFEFSGREIYTGVIYPRESFMGFLGCDRNPTKDISPIRKRKFREFVPLLMTISWEEPRSGTTRRSRDIIIESGDSLFNVQGPMNYIFEQVETNAEIIEESEALISINKFFTA